MKKKFLFILGLVFAMILSGCSGKKEEIDPSKGLNENQLTDGYYIQKEDGFYYPMLRTGFQGSTYKYQWFTSEYDQRIPELNTLKGDKIVFLSKKNRPVVYKFFKMEDLGYTIGTRFDVNNPFESGISELNVKFSSEFCGTSPIGKVVKENVDTSSAVITEINTTPLKWVMFTKEGFLKGLQKDALYKFGYYNGTLYSDIDIKADTHVFTVKEELESTSYIEDRDKFFFINLPASADSGYYVLEGAGLFKYIGDDSNLIEKDKVVEDEELDKILEGSNKESEKMPSDQPSDPKQETPAENAQEGNPSISESENNGQG